MMETRSELWSPNSLSGTLPQPSVSLTVLRGAFQAPRNGAVETGGQSPTVCLLVLSWQVDSLGF